MALPNHKKLTFKKTHTQKKNALDPYAQLIVP